MELARTPPMRVAMIGLRGLPATWGGVERHVEELGSRLVQRGHEVTVYSRPSYCDAALTEYRGMQLKCLRTVEGRGIEALAHSLQAAVHALTQDYDIVHFHAVGPGLATPLSRAFSRAAVVQTVHGLDADRAKWNGAGRAALRLGTWLSGHVPDETIVVSKELQEHYADVYRRVTVHITNGVPKPVSAPAALLRERYGLEPGSYLFHVGRLVPEKAADLLVEAFAAIPDPDLRLVIAGDSADTDDYVHELKRLAGRDSRVRLVGYAGGDDLAALYTHARAYVSASRLEGLPLTLLEATAYRLPLVVSGIPPHVEVVGDRNASGVHVAAPGSVSSFSDALVRALSADPALERRAAAVRSERLMPHYSWDAVARQTESVYTRVLRRRGRLERTSDRRIDLEARGTDAA